MTGPKAGSGTGSSEATAARPGNGGVPEAPDAWTVLNLILWSAEYLRTKGVDRARLDGEHLLAHALGMKRLDLYLQYDRPLAREELDAFRPLLKRRARREPLQYILGHQPFRELDLEVDGRVLIPRPETEVLVGEVLGWVEAREDGGALDALDVGTGSGAIALSLALEGPFRRVVGTDPAPEALELAARNRAAAGLDGKVELRAGADYEGLEPDEQFDVIVSNPPYVARGERAELEPEIVEWEPAIALFAGEDGLDVVRRLVAGAPGRLRPDGLLALEVGSGQVGAVRRMLESAETWKDVEVKADLTGRERVVTAKCSRPDGPEPTT
ncbi:MAG: peptide chain release factor N(5)-glutamine methyltransferase [Gemmatimonadota bacterium]|nr:peptide chain release factor N(5)-glutamine methyltransferase [Gemmatimonadota bacterium]